MAWLRDIDKWFGEAVLPFAPTYRAYARKLTGDPVEAEDLVQEAYAKVLGLPDWRRLEQPERFVLTIIRNLAFERFRRAKVVGIRQIGVLEMEALPDPAPDAHAVASAREELLRVLEAVDRLPQQCRKVVTLRKMEGLSPGQIAVRLNLSISTVEKHLAKGLALLTKSLAASEGRRIGSKAGSWSKRAIKTETR
ncbi:RNA polymerase sigma factor [Caulobacter sp. RL271]|jgi:RNA polymerase sigma-70 factor (ECF subfamily)|uniref:RNA polymerase sigma factor n=1 Tax=Caulobacter segnis TaxID=88688 RepID=A0ABY4ZZ74_9CAUL|nr:RNA polymerase sigma factor [Caulobacter segnis]USQ98085.1 RNA polymerase sigma factor [Caulobacter segnis]